MGRFWDPKSLPYAFDSFSIRSSTTHSDCTTSLSLSPERQTLCVCFEHVQNKRQGLALQVAHGDPIALLTRHQIALRDLDSLCIALLYFRTRSSGGSRRVPNRPRPPPLFSADFCFFGRFFFFFSGAASMNLDSRPPPPFSQILDPPLRSGSAIMIVSRCDWNSFLLWCTDSCRKLEID